MGTPPRTFRLPRPVPAPGMPTWPRACSCRSTWLTRRVQHPQAPRLCVAERRMPFHGYFRMRSDPIRLDSFLLLAYSMPPMFALTQTTTFPSEKVLAAPLFVACWLLTTSCAVRSTPPVRIRECVASGETRPLHPSCPTYPQLRLQFSRIPANSSVCTSAHIAVVRTCASHIRHPAPTEHPLPLGTSDRISIVLGHPQFAARLRGYIAYIAAMSCPSACH